MKFLSNLVSLRFLRGEDSPSYTLLLLYLLIHYLFFNLLPGLMFSKAEQVTADHLSHHTHQGSLFFKYGRRIIPGIEARVKHFYQPAVSTEYRKGRRNRMNRSHERRVGKR